MINTAVEAAVDVATTSFDPLAKLAKDIAAGAVLISTAFAVAVGYLVFAGRSRAAARTASSGWRVARAPRVIALVLTSIVVIAIKALSGRGTPVRGGLPRAMRRSRSRWMAAALSSDSSHQS